MTDNSLPLHRRGGEGRGEGAFNLIGLGEELGQRIVAGFAFGGTHGSASGTYSLKISSRAAAAPADQPPAAGSMGLAIKRLAVPGDARRLRIEALLAYKVEQDRPGLGVDDLRAFGMFVDLQDDEHRYMPGVRYVNAVGGEPVRLIDLLARDKR